LLVSLLYGILHFMDKQEKAIKVLKLLKSQYPTLKTHLVAENAWELLVATVLAAQCTDARVNKISPKFFSLWAAPCDLAKAAIEDVEKVIYSTGFYHNKAKNLVLTAQKIMQCYDGQVPNTMQDLIKLPGLARKTSNVVLWGAFGINEGIAVDTHVKRISYRLELTANTNPDKVEKDLMQLFPQKEWGWLNQCLVWFGRDVCQARKPLCTHCKMKLICSNCTVLL